jgi:hypothetical protein
MTCPKHPNDCVALGWDVRCTKCEWRSKPLKPKPLTISGTRIMSEPQRKLSPEEQRWAKVHVMADKRKPLPEWWGKRR